MKSLILLLFLATSAFAETVQVQDGVDANFMTVNPDGSINVNTSGGGGGGTQYLDGTVNATPTGTVSLGKDPSNVLKALGLSTLGNLNVNLAEGTITGGNAAASPTGSPVPAAGSYTAWDDGGTLRGVSSAKPFPVSQQGTVTVTGPLTDTQLRATAVPVSASSLPLPTGAATATKQDSIIAALGSPMQDHITIGSPAACRLVKADGSAFYDASGSGGGGLTDTELRASPVAVSGTVTATGPLTDTQLRATAVPVSGPLTDTQLRASAVPVSLATLPPLVAGSAVIGHVIVDTAPTTAVTGPLTDTQLRATPVPVSGSLGRTWSLSSGSDSVASTQSGAWSLTNISGTISLPTGASTAAKQDTGNASSASIDGKITTDAQGIKTSVSNRVTTITGSGVAQDDTPIASTDVTGFSTADIEVKCSGSGTGTATAVFESSNDNSAWYPLFATGATVLKTPQEIEAHSFYVVNASACADNQVYHVRFVGKYFRMRIDFLDVPGQTISAVAKVNTLDIADPLPVTKTSLQDYFGISFIAGQQNMANSFPVVFASNQTALPVTGAFYQATQPVSLLTLPSLAAGSALIGHVIVDTAPTTAVTIASLPALSAGSALIGKVGIDQTTPGTTNGVQVNAALPSGTNVIGHVINDASSAVIGHVIADTGSTTAVTGTVTANATLSAETTKVIGTVNVSSGQTVGLVAGSALVGKVGIDQTTPGTTNGVQVNAALPAGTNAIGKLAANSGVIIGDVNLVSAIPAGTNGIGKLTTNTGVTIGAVEIAAAQTLSTVTTVGAVTSITNALPAGTNAIGKLSANGGVTIGDVNVISDIPGTGATNLGKAEDAGHTSADVGVMMLGVRKDTATQVTSADADYTAPSLDAYGAAFVREDHPNRIRCTVTVSTATTIQAVGGSCAAPGAGLSIYVTDVMFDSSAAGIAADAFPTLKYGTGGTCGTGTTVFWGALTAAAVTKNEHFSTPIKIPANNEVCWITSTAGSKFVQILGFIAP